MKHLLKLLFLLNFGVLQCMDEASLQPLDTQISTQFQFTYLPHELNNRIIEFVIKSANSLQEACKNIHHIADKVLNDKNNFEFILRTLGDHFNLVNNRFICKTLGTHSAKQWLNAHPSPQPNLVWHNALNENNITKIKTLLLNGIYIDTLDMSHQPPLLVAVESNNLPLVELLLTNGANTQLRDNRGYTPLYFALISGKKNIVNALITIGHEANRNFLDYTFIKAALTCNNYHMIKDCIIKKADINYPIPCEHYSGKGRFGKALELSLVNHNFVTAKLLAFHGAKASPMALKLLMHHGLHNNDNDFINYCLDNSINVDEWYDINERIFYYVPNNQRTALMLATKNNNLKFVRLLLKKGANVNLQIEGVGNTALIIAALVGYPRIVRILLAYGADKTLLAYAPEKYITALDVAKNTEIIEMLTSPDRIPSLKWLCLEYVKDNENQFPERNKILTQELQDDLAQLE